MMDISLNPSLLMDHSTSKSDSLVGTDGLTGHVGTALYVSPEVMDTTHRTHYNQVGTVCETALCVCVCVCLSVCLCHVCEPRGDTPVSEIVVNLNRGIIKK